jgi:hypothetical protein
MRFISSRTRYILFCALFLANFSGFALLRRSSAAAVGNLIINGDFSQGNTGFTSDYQFSENTIWPDQYAIGKNPRDHNPQATEFGDHTTGDGLMLIADGFRTANKAVWAQTVNVSPNTVYTMSAWVATWGGGGTDPNPPQLDFLFNDVLLGDPFTAPAKNGQWAQFSADWFSGENTTVNIRIINNTLFEGGNDLALDDLSLTAVPEPSAWALMAGLVGGSASLGWRRRKAAQSMA